MNKLAILLLTLVVSLQANASQKASIESVEKLMELMEVSKLMDTMHSQMTTLYENLATQMDLSEQDQMIYEKHRKKLVGLLREELSWDKFKQPMFEIYARHYSEQEVQGLIEFYQSELGQSTIKKMPLIMKDSMGVSQKLSATLLPKIQQITREMAEEVRKSRETGSAS